MKNTNQLELAANIWVHKVYNEKHVFYKRFSLLKNKNGHE